MIKTTQPINIYKIERFSCGESVALVAGNLTARLGEYVEKQLPVKFYDPKTKTEIFATVLEYSKQLHDKHAKVVLRDHGYTCD